MIAPTIRITTATSWPHLALSSDNCGAKLEPPECRPPDPSRGCRPTRHNPKRTFPIPPLQGTLAQGTNLCTNARPGPPAPPSRPTQMQWRPAASLDRPADHSPRPAHTPIWPYCANDSPTGSTA